MPAGEAKNYLQRRPETAWRHIGSTLLWQERWKFVAGQHIVTAVHGVQMRDVVGRRPPIVFRRPALPLPLSRRA